MTATAEAIRAPEISRAFYTPQEVSTLTGTTERHVLNLAKRGELASVRFGHRVLIPVEEIDRLKESARASRA